jgi:hypothetical protein
MKWNNCGHGEERDGNRNEKRVRDGSKTSSVARACRMGGIHHGGEVGQVEWGSDGRRRLTVVSDANEGLQTTVLVQQWEE